MAGASVDVASLARNVNHAVDGAQHEDHQPWTRWDAGAPSAATTAPGWPGWPAMGQPGGSRPDPGGLGSWPASACTATGGSLGTSPKASLNKSVDIRMEL